MSDIKNLKKEIKKLKARGSKDKIVQMVIDEKERQLKELEMLTLLSGKEVTLDDLMALRGEDYIDFGYPKDKDEDDEDDEEDEEVVTISLDELLSNLPKEDRSLLEQLVKEIEGHEDKPELEEESTDPNILSFEEFSREMEKVVGEFGGKFVKQTGEKRKAVEEKLFGLEDNPKVKELDKKIRPTVDKAVDFGQRKFGELKDFVEEKVDFSGIQEKFEENRKILDTYKFLKQHSNAHALDVSPDRFTVWFDEFGSDVYFTFADEHTLTKLFFFNIDHDRDVVDDPDYGEFIQTKQSNLIFEFPNGRHVENFGDGFELDAIVSDYYA